MANRYQKCVAAALRGKHFRSKASRLAGFRRVARKCAKACRPKDKRHCKR